MNVRKTIVLISLVTLTAGSAWAQHGPGAGGSPLQTSAPAEARQLDFLIGQWELTAEPKVSLLAKLHGSPKMSGVWKAWRAGDGFGVEDELRLTDESGNPRLLSIALRVHDRDTRRWSASTLDVYRARFVASTGEWKDGQMTFSARSTDADGKAYVSRVRFFDISPNAFRWQQDRSYDDGRTWEEGTLRIEAKRAAVSAPR